MNLITEFVLIPFAGILLIPFLKVRRKGILTLILLTINALLSGIPAVKSLTGETISVILLLKTL